ncbi:MAG: right-handed parallel beta-helix repeat-containing protein [Kiritimatiellaeota bacterium]|nr:right-handed parallel beta-helix repeat-containing protein [Kiritimatiellota bacterium]
MKRMAVVLVAVACGVRAAVWEVSDGAGLAAALAGAGAHDEVRLEGGVYVSPAGATFTVPAEVTVKGGYSSDFLVRDIASYPSVLDGDGKAISVVTVDGADVTLDGIVITGAYGINGDDGTPAKGAVPARGLYKGTGGELILRDCVISNNVTLGRGADFHGPAAWFTGGGTITMERCVIEKNGRAGTNAYENLANGVYASNVTLMIDQCRFSGQFCHVNENRTTRGGALYFSIGTLAVSGTLFEENRSASNGSGGGAVWLGGNITAASFDNCLFRDNGFLQNGGTSWGGAVAIRDVGGLGEISFNQCVFADNFSANANGGALYMNSGTVTLRNSIFRNNTITVPSFNGKEIYVEGSGILDADFLCFTDTASPEFIRLPTTLSLGAHVMASDPLFASADVAPYDFHLMSQAGRWEDGDWVYTDMVTSPCIDAGSEGGELGIYGGTAEASKSLVSEAPLVDVLEPYNIHYTRYRLGGELTNDVPFNAATVHYICYGTTEILADTTNGWDTVVVGYPPAQKGIPFTTVTPLLLPNTTYHVRVYAENGEGFAWSDSANFLTGSTLPFGYGVGGGADTVHVRASATEGDQDGSDWFHAFTSIGAAVDAIGGTRTNLWISGEEYALLPGLATIPANVVMLGGFDGTEYTPEARTLDADGWAVNPTVIRGGDGQLVINGSLGAMDNITFTDFQLYPTLRLNNTVAFDFTRCAFTNNAFRSNGNLGLVSLNGGTVSIAECIFSDNRTGYGTQGIGVNAAANTALTVLDCDFSRNRGLNFPYDSRQSRGGGISFNGTSLLVERTRFSGNEISAHDDNGGGGIALSGAGSVVIRYCLFENNTLVRPYNVNGNGLGAAIRSDMSGVGTALIEHCVFVGNDSEGILASDGAIAQRGGAMTLRNNIFWDNFWDNGSGAQIAEVSATAGTTVLGYNSFSDIAALRLSNGAVIPATTIYGDPRFADVGDYHLQSPFGRWDPAQGTWEEDENLSPCIDAGDPADDFSLEPLPNGDRVNLGLYGGTAEASKSFDAAAVSVALVDCVSADYTQMKMIATTVSSFSVGNCSVGFVYGLTQGSTTSTNGWDHVVMLSAAQPVGAEFSALTHYLETNTTYHYMAFAVATPLQCSAPSTFQTGSEYPAGWGVGGDAATVHVRKEATGNNNGSDWFNAYVSLEDGLAAMSDDRPTLWVGSGAYFPTVHITLTNGQQIVGGFAGTESSPAQRARMAEGGIAAVTEFNGAGEYRAIFAQEGDILLDAIALANIVLPASGSRTLAALNKSGAGTLRMVDGKVTGNRYNGNETQEGTGCRFVGAGEVIMERCDISDNVNASFEVWGIGIYSEVTLTLTDCRIAGNHAANPASNYDGSRASHGFGIAVRSGSLAMVRTEVIGNYGAGNQSYNRPGGGAGLYVGDINANGQPIQNNVFVSGVFITNCLFRGNICYSGNSGVGTGGGAGAAIRADFFQDTVPFEVINCTFTGNRSEAPDSRGGALYVKRGQVTIRNAIFHGNSVSGTTPMAEGHDLYLDNTTATLSTSCIETESAVSGFSNTVMANGADVTFGDGLFYADPLFVSDYDPLFPDEADSHLQSKAGYWDRATRTWLKSLANSPCINAGDKADDHSLEPLPSGSRINLGAYGNTREASKTQPLNTLIIVR